MQQGDWEKFGKAMDALKRLLTGPAPSSTTRELMRNCRTNGKGEAGDARTTARVQED